MKQHKILNTEMAHQEYSTSLVGVIVFLTKGNNEIAIFEEEDNLWSFPERFARGDEALEDSVTRIVSSYVSSGAKVNISSTILLSGEEFRQDAYQFNFVVFVPIDSENGLKKKVRWISSGESFLGLRINPTHRKLLEKFFSEGCLKDRLVVPHNLSKRPESDAKRLTKTKEIHALHFPMPLITVDGLLLKFSEKRQFEGIILEKRASTLDREPSKWVLPAGFVQAHETMSEALAYEVYEEIRVSLKENQFVSIFKIDASPHRDPKWFVWTEFLVAFTTADLPKNSLIREDVTMSQEVEMVRAFPLSGLPPANKIAFDHAKILEEFSTVVQAYIQIAQERISK